ncbi:MAG: phosphomannomutase/phosphoglucomutase [Phycisphaerales bacterium]|nr:MAG: phosphomannomutase/phosphoglucomutase [Phycisphaerales bacterium]
MLGKVFKAYDIRGTHPDPLNERMAWQIGYGVSSHLLGKAAADGETTPMMKHIVVGRDMRKSSPALVAKLIEGITDQGGNVIDVGLVDTPFIYFAINHLDCVGGVQTTASHNPPQYNGFKVSGRRGAPIGESTGLAEVRKLAATAEEAQRSNTSPKGRVEQRDLWEAYTGHVRSFLDLNGRTMKVVVDASNGMAGTMVPRVFGEGGANVQGLEIVEINFDNRKGEFVHEANPLLPSALAQTREAVVAEGADLGLCFDGDADRIVVVDEKGEAVGCDHLTAWLAKWFLKDNPGAAVVYDLRSSKALEEDVLKAGGAPIKSRVGHVFIKQILKERKGVFGGELSGHFYFRDNYFADSGAIAMATVLTALAHAKGTMSEQIKPVARYAQSGEINFHVEDKDGALADVRKAFGADGEIDELDGVTVDCFRTKGWWCNVRKSNTEPLLRLNLEARDRKTLDEMLVRIAPMLGERAEE